MGARRKLLWAAAGLLVLLVAVPCLYQAHLKDVTAAYIAQLSAEGEPLWLPKVLPPAVPPAGNSADTFLRASALLAKDSSLLRTNDLRAMWEIDPGQAVVCSQLPRAIGYGSTNSWTEVAAAVAQNEDALKLLRQITGHPALDFHLNDFYGQAGVGPYGHLQLGEFRYAASLLRDAAILALHSNDLDSAVADQRAALAVVYGMQNQRLVISELVRFPMLAIVASVTWETLQNPHVSDAQLAALQRDWGRLNLVQDSLNAFLMKRVTDEMMLRRWRRSPAEIAEYFESLKKAQPMGLETDGSESAPSTGVKLKTFLWQYWWSYPDELRLLQGYQVVLATSRQILTNDNFGWELDRQTQQLASLQIKIPSDGNFNFLSSIFETPDFHSLFSNSIGTLASATKRLMTAETSRRITFTAIALQRFKLAHNHFPDHLADLVPEFLSAVPNDPVDGQPLRYRLKPDGTFLLYSVGQNRVDDGGNPATSKKADYIRWQNPDALDWVWPQASTVTNSPN